MEPQNRAPNPDLIQRLSRDARLYSFFQVVQLVQGRRQDIVRVGHAGAPSGEVLRFRPSMSLAFPPSDLSAVETTVDSDGRERVLVEETFLGLYGSSSPLPSHYAEDVLHDTSEDSLVRGFLDLFHHRVVSLFYRCWEKYRYYIQFRAQARDDFSWRLLCLCGLGTAGTAERSAVPPAWLLRYASILAQRPCSAAGLGAMISDYFDRIPTDVQCCIPREVVVPRSEQCRLGVGNSTLGRDVVVGESVLDLSGKFRVGLGPMDLETYLSFLPGGDKLKIVGDLARLGAGDLLAFEVELKLQPETLPALHLAPDSWSCNLGHTTWLGRQPGPTSTVIQEEGLCPEHDGAAPHATAA